MTGIAGVGGLALTGVGGGLAGVAGALGLGGLGGNIGGIAGLSGGQGIQNLGVGGGGVTGFAGFGGQLGQFGNLGGQFGLQGGDQSRILIKLITQIVGTPADWAPAGLLQQLQPSQGPLGPQQSQDDTQSGSPEGSQLGFYPPAMSLLVKATSLVHTRSAPPSAAPRVNPAGPAGGAALDVPHDTQVTRANPGRDRTPAPRGERAAPGSPSNPSADSPVASNRPRPDLDPTKIWQEALSKGVDNPGLIIACTDFLMQNGYGRHTVEFLKANLQQGIVSRPWVYEALTMSLKATKASADEIERAQLSMVDLSPDDPAAYLKASHAMSEDHQYDRAVALCRQAATLAPEAAQPYSDALAYADLAKDSQGMEWAAGNLLRRDWAQDSNAFHLEAEDRLKMLSKTLADEKRQAEADRLIESAAQSRIRDLIIQLSWQGEGDIDLEVKEPIGTVCSFLHRQTGGGGTLMGDTLADHNHQAYTAASAFSGDYAVKLRRVWGRPLGSKVTLDVIEHKGTARETRQRKTIQLERETTVTIHLDDGRRRSIASVQASARAKTEKPSKRPMSSDDAVLNQLRALASPDMGSYSSTLDGGCDSAGIPSENFVLPMARAGEMITSEGKLDSLVGTAAEVTTQTTVSADRRYVRVTAAPVFETVTDRNVGTLVTNPGIPGDTRTREP